MVRVILKEVANARTNPRATDALGNVEAFKHIMAEYGQELPQYPNSQKLQEETP